MTAMLTWPELCSDVAVAAPTCSMHVAARHTTAVLCQGRAACRLSVWRQLCSTLSKSHKDCRGLLQLSCRRVVESLCVCFKTLQDYNHDCNDEGPPTYLPGSYMGLAVGAGLLTVCVCCVAQQLLVVRCLVQQANTCTSCQHMSAGNSLTK